AAPVPDTASPPVVSPPVETTATSPAAPAPPRPSTARPPKPTIVTSYEAESPANGRYDTRTFTCTGCSGGKKVGDIGRDTGVLRFNGVAATSGPITVTFAYVNGEDTRAAQLSVDGARPGRLGLP